MSDLMRSIWVFSWVLPGALSLFEVGVGWFLETLLKTRSRLVLQ